MQDRKSTLLVDHIELLRESVRQTKRAQPFHINAWVVLPEHIHAVWTLPAGDANYSGRWRSIKAYFSRELDKIIQNAQRNTKGEYAFWQRRFWEHTLRNDADYARHIDYIHFNPVKHGHVKNVGDWPYSSFHRFVGQNLYPLDWAGVGNDEGERDGFGE